MDVFLFEEIFVISSKSTLCLLCLEDTSLLLSRNWEVGEHYVKNIENLLDFQQSGGITQRQAVAKFIKYSEYQTGQASRRAIDFSRAFWYRLLEDKVVRPCSTPIIQIRRCRRDILQGVCDKGRASTRKWRWHEHEGNSETANTSREIVGVECVRWMIERRSFLIYLLLKTIVILAPSNTFLYVFFKQTRVATEQKRTTTILISRKQRSCNNWNFNVLLENFAGCENL